MTNKKKPEAVSDSLGKLLRISETGKRILILTAGILLGLLLSHPLPVLQAEGTQLPVVLRDPALRKVLIRKGCSYETDGPLYLELPAELIRQGEVLQIEVVGTEAGSGRKRSYSFSCTGKGEAAGESRMAEPD